jgi:hypothetical protein
MDAVSLRIYALSDLELIVADMTLINPSGGCRAQEKI